jgi:histidinol phosphatase-like enzyme
VFLRAILKRRYNDIIPKLAELHKDGYRLAIFANHSPIGRAVHPDAKRNGMPEQENDDSGEISFFSS